MQSNRAGGIVSLVAFGASALVGSASASVIFYTDEPNFLTHISPGYYLEEFSSIGLGILPSPQTFSGGSPTFSCEASAPSGLFGVEPTDYTRALSVNDAIEPLTITFTGASVRAVGGQFFATEFLGDVASGSVTITLSDGSTHSANFPPVGFLGFVATGGTIITSLEVTSNLSDWPAVDHLYVGVPEPQEWALVSGLGMAALAFCRRSCRA
jgi:hypothetical protein